MAKEELQALAEEASAAPAEEAAQLEEQEELQEQEERKEKPAVPAGPVDPRQIRAICNGLVAGVGARMCRRANVTPLEPEEVDFIGEALQDVITVYGLDQYGDPRVMAWLGLFGAVYSVASNRRPLEPANDDNAAPEHPEESAGASGEGYAGA